MHLPELDQIGAGVEVALTRFVDDSRASSRAEGTIAFWPYLKVAEGEWLHTPSRIASERSFTHNGDLPNDLDDSAHAALYFAHTPSELGNNFIKGYIETLTRLIDPVSGGFLTWVDAFPGVDCVVNQNILTSLLAIAKHFPEEEPAINALKETAERYLGSVLQSGEVPECEVYYGRGSQFLVAYAKYVTLGGRLPEQDEALILELLNEAIASSSAKSLIELAELLISCQSFGSEAEMCQRHQSDMDETVKRRLPVFFATKDPWAEEGDLFVGNFGDGPVGWYSKAQTATLGDFR